jgi:hypothetical protein
MGDDMFFSTDARSLRRGRRIARRTPTCRPCLVWPTDAPEMQFRGVVLDINPYGMLVRMMEPIPQGTDVWVQLMRDEQFAEALSRPVAACVVRHSPSSGLFLDHGLRIRQDAGGGRKSGPGSHGALTRAF